MAPHAAELPGTDGGADAQACHRYAGELTRALEFPRDRASLVIQAAATGLTWTPAPPSDQGILWPPDQLRGAFQAVMRDLPRLVDGELARIRIARIERNFAAARAAVAAVATVGDDGSPAFALARAIRTSDTAAYRAAYVRLSELTALRSSLGDRHALLRRLSPSAPDWADSMRLRRPPHGATQPPGNALAAWRWKRIDQRLSERNRADLDEIMRSIAALRSELRAATAALVDRLAWAGELQRITPSTRQSLAVWLETIKKIGKGSGKNVPRLRRAAQEQMASARAAVPVWIAPLSRVAESFDARAVRFDVVIVDEASQSDVMGLIALYLGDQVMVVGDDQQVTPDDVGGRIDVANDLIDTYLRGIPGSHLYDGKASIYQLGGTAFQGVTRLREHFRCVPEIIRFSNAYSYNWEILPLRDGSTARVKPAVVSHRVEAPPGDERRNRDEALHVASLMAAAIEQPEYADLTFGAISLQGHEQSTEIETILRNRLDLAKFERHRILTGTPPQFQGDERDVMFISLVNPPPDQPPLNMRDDGVADMWKKRYNVATSRARDQLWVVHSLDSARDLKTGDIRWKLLQFAHDPASLESRVQQAQARAESPLEREVASRLVTAGYSIEQQVVVGAYRLDIVVGEAGSRVAIECDGDRFHTAENLQRDLERQAQLERCGWRFIRVRGTEFFRDPDATVARALRRLTEFGVETSSPEAAVSAQRQPHELRDRVIRRAAELREAWTGPAQWKQPASRVPRPAPPAAAPPERSRPAADLRGVRQSVQQPLMPAPVSTGAPPDLAAVFQSAGYRVEDHRPKNGALWVYGSQSDLQEAMNQLRRDGIRFTYSKKRGGWFLPSASR
jgi:very-short-patch-repair endonuclease